MQGKGNIFFDNCGPQNEAQNETHCAKVFKMFFDDELMELIVRETNTYAAQKIQAISFIPFYSTMRDWKPVTKDELYDVLALFILMGIIQKPKLRSYFSKKCILATPIFGSIVSMDRFESICNFIHFNKNDNIGIPPTEKRPGQQRGVQCVIKTTEGRRQCFGAPNVKLPYVLKNVSRHSTKS